MTDMHLYNFGTPGRGKTVLLPSSGSWLQDAVAATQEKRRMREKADKWREQTRRRQQKERAHALEALDGDTVEVPEALIDALWDCYLHEHSYKPESIEIINAYLEERA